MQKHGWLKLNQNLTLKLGVMSEQTFPMVDTQWYSTTMSVCWMLL